MRWCIDGHKVNFARGKIPPGGKRSRKCIYSVPGQETAKQCKVWLTSVERRRCSNVNKKRNPLKLPGVPQTNETISAASGPKITILWEHVAEILLLNKFFPIVETCLSCEDIARQICAMVPRWRFLATFLRPVFAASRVPHISDMHSKFALRPHHVSKYGKHPISDR